MTPLLTGHMILSCSSVCLTWKTRTELLKKINSSCPFLHFLTTAWCATSATLCVLSNQMAVKNPAGFHSISVMEIAFPFHELLWLQFRLFWPLYAFQCRALCMTSLKPTLHQWAPCVGRSSTAVSSCKSARLFQGSPYWVIILHQTTQLGRTPCCSAQASQVPLISSLDWGWKQQ